MVKKNTFTWKEQLGFYKEAFPEKSHKEVVALAKETWVSKKEHDTRERETQKKMGPVPAHVPPEFAVFMNYLKDGDNFDHLSDYKHEIDEHIKSLQ